MSEIKRYMENIFKPKQDKITNSTQIKEILDKSKDISTKDEMLIMAYIYDLEEKGKEIERYKKRIKSYQDKIKDLELKNSILEYNRGKENEISNE